MIERIKNNECKQELLVLYNKEQSNPGTVSQKALLAKYIECADYDHVIVMSEHNADLVGEIPEGTSF